MPCLFQTGELNSFKECGQPVKYELLKNFRFGVDQSLLLTQCFNAGRFLLGELHQHNWC